MNLNNDLVEEDVYLLNLNQIGSWEEILPLWQFSIAFIMKSIDQLFQLVLPCTLLYTTTRAGLGSHRFIVVDIRSSWTYIYKRFGFSFLCRTLKTWNTLKALMFHSLSEISIEQSRFVLAAYRRQVIKLHVYVYKTKADIIILGVT